MDGWMNVWLQLRGFLEGNALSGLERLMVEPWFHKDVVQLVCELLVLEDCSPFPHELAAVLLELVLIFGLDGITLIAFCLLLRWKGLGRSQICPGETQSLHALAMSCLQHANNYLLSEHVGDLSLAELVASLSA
jgi:hypothetical protein